MTAETFVQWVLGVLEKIEKSRALADFLSNFGLFWLCFLHTHFLLANPYF